MRATRKDPAGLLRTSFGGWLAGLCLLSSIFIASCGGSDGSADPCAEKSCQFGVCDSATGTCMNEDQCNVSSDCIPGFECTAEGTCEPNQSCEKDADCDSGVCRDGGCTNPDTCSDNSDCMEGTYCATGEGDQGTCEPDPCNDKTCDRGVCERGTDRCVSRESCTQETELEDCVSGQKCANGSCVSEESFCDEVTCERGVCSFEEGGCVDAGECESDEDCLAGKFCNDMNTCKPNLCEQNNVDCGARGECQPNSGRCENASNCESNDDCLADHLCVDGTCRLDSNACGDASGDGGCPGNQVCEYDSGNLEASCVEPDSCETSFDCTGDRRCAGPSCLDPEMCRDDELEPNDGGSNATDFDVYAEGGTLAATVCSGNPDVYAIDTTDYYEVALGGTLVVDVDIPKRDRGLGELEVEVVDADGNSQGTVGTGALGADGRARFTKELMATDHGAYTIEVRPGGDVKQTGVSYELSVDVLPKESLDACKGLETITPNQRVSGTTVDAPSSEYGSSCTSADNDSSERIYELDVDRPQEVEFRLEPKIDEANVAMSLRRRCSQVGTELTCADENLAGGKEKMTELLGPGTYYVVVQSPSDASGGPFTLETRRIYTTCSPVTSYCNSDGNAQTCAVDGGRYSKVECDSGCDPTYGRCVPPAGNVCGNANTIDENNAQTRTVALEQATNDYEMPSETCKMGNDTLTAGPDVSYKVDVPAEKSVRFEAKFADSVEGALYLVGDCTDVGGTCETAANRSTEEDDREVLKYTNFSESESDTFYLVVDTAGGQDVSTAELKVKYRDVICSPGEEQCNGSAGIEKCNEYGAKYETVANCGAGCSGGECSSDTCGDAVNITAAAQGASGVTYKNVSWPRFSNAYDPSGKPCTTGDVNNPGNDTEGPDAFYEVDLAKKERLEATFSAKNPSMWVWQSGDCGSTDASCLASSNETGTNTPAEFTYVSDKQQTVYVATDTEANPGQTFNFNANVSSAQCIPGSYGGVCDGSGDRKICESDGSISTKECVDGCSSGKCDGEVCGDPVVVQDSNLPKTYTFEPEGYENDHDIGNLSSCGSFYDSPGGEAVFEVTVQSGETLQAAMKHDDAILYAVTDCASMSSSCEAYGTQGFSGPASISLSPSSETTYKVVADVDENSLTTYGTAQVAFDFK